MNTAIATAERINPVVLFRKELDNMEGQFRAALPAHIPVERFCRVLMTAMQQNPELLECERRSLWNAAIKAAQDGLLPDGREGAMVVRKDRNRGKLANWQPMVAGIRKKVRNSGEIATWDAHCVYDGDEFQFKLGDEPRIHHAYDLKKPRGQIIGAYSVAVMKDGQKSYEVMTIGEIHAIRDRSDAWKAFKAGFIKSTPWQSDEGEMCRKTVARRHSKVLPMSTDLDDLIRRDDDLYQFDDAKEQANATGRGTLASRLDALAHVSPASPHADEQVEHDPETGEIKEKEVVQHSTLGPIQADPDHNVKPRQPDAQAAAGGADDPGASAEAKTGGESSAERATVARTAGAAPATGAKDSATTDDLAKYDNALAEAAKAGRDALEVAWAKIPNKIKPTLQAAMERRHRPEAGKCAADPTIDRDRKSRP
jgi:recombination protein RecT